VFLTDRCLFLARMHNTASMVAFSESPFIGVSFNYRYATDLNLSGRT
jgi:hypothetical protein